MFCLKTIYIFGFEWLDHSSLLIPDECKELCSSSYAGDIQDFQRYYELRKAITKSIKIRGAPFPPTRMIRPRSIVFRNALKGGVDEYSAAMKSFTRQHSSEHPVVTIVTRMILGQVCNAAIVYRLLIAQQQSLIGTSPEEDKINEKKFNNSFKLIRHSITSVQSLSVFTRKIALDWKYSRMKNDGNNSKNDITSRHINLRRRLSARVPRYAISAFNNNLSLKSLRLEGPETHTQIKANSTYCSLCHYHYTYEFNNKQYKKLGGCKSINWCLECKQNVCKKCWSTWHTVPVLQVREPTSEEKESWNERVSSKNS